MCQRIKYSQVEVMSATKEDRESENVLHGNTSARRWRSAEERSGRWRAVAELEFGCCQRGEGVTTA
jgi:hypothetical protein